MAVGDFAFEQSVRAALKKCQDDRMRLMADGMPHDLYWRAVGYIEGLRAAEAACDQAHRLLVGEDPHPPTQKRP